jgi:glycine oxidase
LLELYRSSTRLFADIVPEVEAESKMRVEYDAVGMIEVSSGEAATQALYRDFQDWQQNLDMSLAWLDERALHSLEPELGPTVYGGVFVEEGAAINSGRMVFALARAAAGRGAQFRQGCLTAGLRRTGSRVTAVQTNEGDLAAGQVVIAAGAWSRTLVEPLGLTLPIDPARGQMISLKPLARLLRHPILANIGGVSAKADGTIHVGGTVDLAGFNKQIRPNDTAQLLESASILIPRLREGPIDRVWTGLRPYCADGLPVIGPVPGWDNVMVAAGHYKLGITGSAITGKIITDLIVAGHSDLPIEPLSPARFG